MSNDRDKALNCILARTTYEQMECYILFYVLKVQDAYKCEIYHIISKKALSIYDNHNKILGAHNNDNYEKNANDFQRND